jgi:hypothetical protein
MSDRISALDKHSFVLRLKNEHIDASAVVRVVPRRLFD